MKNQLAVERRSDGDWDVIHVETCLDRPVIGTILTSSDLYVMNQASTWEIERGEQDASVD